MSTSELVSLMKKNPVFVTCAVLSVGLAVAIYFRSDAIARANAQLDEKTAQEQRFSHNIANSAQLKEQVEAMTTATKGIEARMISASDIGINQQFFYKLESDTGVKLTELRQGRPGPTTGAYQPIPFTVSLKGDFPSVMNFLRSLEDGTHYCRILTASCTGGRTGPVVVTINLELLGRS